MDLHITHGERSFLQRYNSQLVPEKCSVLEIKHGFVNPNQTEQSTETNWQGTVWTPTGGGVIMLSKAFSTLDKEGGGVSRVGVLPQVEPPYPALSFPASSATRIISFFKSLPSAALKNAHA